MNLEEYFDMLHRMASADKARRTVQVPNLRKTPGTKPNKAPGKT